MMETLMSETAHHDFLRRFTSAQPALRRYVLAHVPDFHQAEDVLQEVAVVLWDRIDEYDPRLSFQGWAFGIARHKILHARRSSTRRMVLTDDLAERFAAKLQEVVPQFEQKRGLLKRCMEKLAERARSVLELRYGDGLSTEEIAETTGGSANAVRILLCRTRRSLARCLEGVQG